MKTPSFTCTSWNTFNDALDKSLPYTAYLVEYKVDDKPAFDIAIASKQIVKPRIERNVNL